MKFLATLLLLIAAVMVTVDAYRHQLPPINKRPFPGFPGYGPFNPRPSGRYARSPQENGQVDVHATKDGGKTSWSVEGQHKVWSNEHGNVHVSGGANQQPGGRPQGQVGVGGSFHWR